MLVNPSSSTARTVSLGPDFVDPDGVRTDQLTLPAAGAAVAKPTKTTVTFSRLAVSGRVSGAVSGYVRVSVQRKRGKTWTTVRRVKPSISKHGAFKAAIASLASGSYSAVATFEGTGTAVPSRFE